MVKHGMVVAPQSEAAEVALDVLQAGGNAFDAAIAGALAQGVVDPHRCGIGGFGAAMLYAAGEGRVHSLTFFGRAGSRAAPHVWEKTFEGAAPDGFGYLVAGKENDVGYRSITTPGQVAGLAALSERYGRMPWRDVVSRAALLARRGFLVGPQLHAFWRRPGLFGRVSTRERLGFTGVGRALWLAGGEPPKTGDVVRQDALAATYEHLAAAGPGDFYRGELGDRMARDFEAYDAFVTREDLASYRVRWEAPLQCAFAGHAVLSTPLPGGGVALLQVLLTAQRWGVCDLPLNSAAYVDALARLFSAVQHDRVTCHADPEFETVATGALLSPAYIDALLEARDRRVGGESPDTTEIVVVDARGNAVVLAHSLGYGSGVFTSGMGFMYNNCMSGFDPVPETANGIRPGKARSTAIAQTIVMRDGAPCLVVGAPGGSHITAGLAQALINRLALGLDMQDAVCRPRFDAYRRTLLLESRMPYTLEEALGGRWEIARSPNPFGMVGRVYAIARDGDRLAPGYDPGEPATVREA